MEESLRISLFFYSRTNDEIENFELPVLELQI